MKIREIKDKASSLEWLRDNGFNTPKFEIAKTIQEARRFLIDLKDEYKKFSLRGVGRGSLQPFYCNIDFKEAFMVLEDFKECDKIIISEGIDPVYSEIAGKILFSSDNCFVEYLEGPGITVRDIERNTLYLKRASIEELFLTPEIIRELQQITFKIKREMDKMKICIVEFSFYQRPIGWKSQRIIFWEVIPIWKKEN